MGYHIYAIGKAIRALFADRVTYADFDSAMCFLIGGRLRLDYRLQGIPLHRCKYSLKVSSLLSCAELQYKVQG